MIRMIAGIGAMVALLTGATFLGQDPWVRQVRVQLAQSTVAMNLTGYTLTHGPITNQLNHNRYRTHTLQLRAGVEYSILGVCDEYCEDLDFKLFDPSGRLVDQDLEPDDYPVVSVMPGRTGTYTLRVIMAACYDEPCRYGFAAYGY